MQATLVDFSKDTAVFNISGGTRAELENKLNLFFNGENLTLQKDTPEEKIYQKGSKVARALLGVFVKYFNIVVSVREEAGLFSVKITRKMNWYMSGGAIGMVKARTEFSRIIDAFKVNFK